MNVLYRSNGFEVYERSKRLVEVALCYPRIEDGRVNTIEIGLSDVRAADSIRVTYDFERDGWSVQQASIFEWAIDDPTCDADWQEVAFVQAWAREKKVCCDGHDPACPTHGVAASNARQNERMR